jgi:hypothetical protein
MGKNYLGGQFMKKKLFFAGMLALALVFGLILAGCPTDSDDDDGGNNSGGGGGGNGTGTITITGLKAGLNGATIAHNLVSGTHSEFNAFTLRAGTLSGATFDDSGSSTITSGSVTIPVRGTNSTSASYEFKNGVYTVSLTIDATDNAFDGQYTVAVTFNGANGTGTGSLANGLGLN